MTKFHSLLLALAVSFSMYSQTTLSFSACTSGNPNEIGYDFFTDQAQNVYLSTTNPQVFLKSTDGGKTFSNQLFSGTCGTFAMIALGNKIISVDKMSTDGGATWTNHSLFSSFGTVQQFIKINETQAIAYFGGSYSKTFDGGNTWSNVVIIQNAFGGLGVVSKNIITMKNGDIIVPFGSDISYNKYLVSKDNLSTFSYSITAPPVSNYNSGFIDENNNYVFVGFYGRIDAYNQNQNSTAPTYTNSFTLSPATSTVSYFKTGKQLNDNSFITLIDPYTSSAPIIYKTAGTTTNTANSINELSNAKISLYPNPCVNQITIEGTQSNVNYIISNQLGQTMLQGTTNGSINTSVLMPGVYFVTLNSNQVIKFIKE